MSHDPSPLAITVNGEAVTTSAKTLDGFLEAREIDPRTVAVEINGSIAKRSDYAATVLVSGDRLEIVRFVQGG